MGLLNFWKKKSTLEQPTSPYKGIDSLNTDLPPIEGGSFDGSTIQQFGGMQSQSPSGEQTKTGESKSISFNVPTFDFSLPASDESSAESSASTAKPAPTSSTQPSFSEVGLPVPTDISSSTSQIIGADNGDVEVDDLNKLFISDDWKEPDWNSFDPYTEDKIEEPIPDDFKGADLPAFDESESKDSGTLDKSPIAQTAQSFDDEPILEPRVPLSLEKDISAQKPVELFIRGRVYNGVFTELDQMNKALTKIDAQVSGYEDMLKREEPLLASAKDQMEYLYKRLNQVDKKIFAQ